MTGLARIEAVHDGKAAARDQTNNYAPSPELVEALIASATRPLERLNDRQQAKIQELQEKLGVSDGVLHRVAVLLAEHLKTDNIDFDEIPQRFLEMLGQREALMAQQSALSQDPDVQFARMQEEIDAALKSGDDELARELLMRKRDGKLAASEKRTETADTLLAAATRDRLDAASSEAALGDLARSCLEYLVAAEHFRFAVEILPPSASLQWDYLRRHADALYMHGVEKGDNASLVQSIEVYRLTLHETPRESEPQDWAANQNNLGNALSILGERESGTTRLEQALEAYCAALEERTRERVPLDWAATQNNLGKALLCLGKRKNDAALLDEALQAMEGAWEVYKGAGMDQYDVFFEAKIAKIKSAVVALRGK